MTYSKPELLATKAALDAIQGMPKDTPGLPDSIDPSAVLGSVAPAYEVDE